MEEKVGSRKRYDAAARTQSTIIYQGVVCVNEYIPEHRCSYSCIPYL